MVLTKPPMGWNSWNSFGNEVNEKIVLENADAIVERGLKDAGYEYVVIDDHWSLRGRDEKGKLVPDPEKFPHGMKFIADRLHEKGLKFGMYSCDGVMTCGGFPASYDYEFQDAETFAQWGVDYLKYDNCFKPSNEQGRILYRRMGVALANCGRDIVFSACNWGMDNVQDWIKETGAHLWRSTHDIIDNWAHIKELARLQPFFFKYNSPNCFCDMDMLIAGMENEGFCSAGGCTFEEYKTHFGIWSFLQSPLMLGCDVRKIKDEYVSLLTNPRLIALNQDLAGRQPYCIRSYDEANADLRNPDSVSERLIMAKNLENGDIALCLVNFADSKNSLTVMLTELGLNRASGKALELTDLYTGKSLGLHHDYFMTDIEPHSSMVIRAKVVPAAR